MPALAVTAEFLGAMSKLQKRQQKKVLAFFDKWKADSKSAAINFEKIHNMRDERVRTVRIDQKYRAVMLHPNEGDTYVLVWVDNHDEAMDWAKNKEFGVNPATGAFQIINVDHVQALVESVSTDSTEQLFACSDDDLLAVGVPSVLIKSIRSLQSADDIQQLTGVLPDEIVESLFWLADGTPVAEVMEDLQSRNAAKSGDSSMESAIDNDNSKRRVVRIQSMDELEAMLDAPLDKWRVFLHPVQADVASRQFSGPALVTGTAGTGKTVVAIHRTRHLLRTCFTAENDRVLFTTYTTNLADNLRSLLNDFCGDESCRLDVRNLDSWAVGFLAEHGQEVSIATDDDVSQAWDLAAMEEDCPVDAMFLRDEWSFACDKGMTSSKDAYLALPRIGRPQRLDQIKKAKIWNAFEACHRNLELAGKSSWADIADRARRLVEKPIYRSIVVDEAQDFSGPSWRLIRSLVEPGNNDLFLVGDKYQRIYGGGVDLSSCGIDVKGRTSVLRVNYRTTEQIQSWACLLYTSDAADE